MVFWILLDKFQNQSGQDRSGADAVLQYRPDAVVFRVQRGFGHGGETGFPHEVRQVFQRPLRKTVRLRPELLPHVNQFRARIIVEPLQMHVDQSVDKVDFRRVELRYELPAAAAQRNRRLELMRPAAGEGVVPLLELGQHFAQLGLPVQEFGHGAHRHVFVLIVEERYQAFKTRFSVHSRTAPFFWPGTCRGAPRWRSPSPRRKNRCARSSAGSPDRSPPVPAACARRFCRN
ncbi:hypothetical protein SDC9_146952 [bioreactor metagenome]|uniref:Uncharacterized protein n=1 Tax=bioreactor metagenome TaxID=1076179 RepID=A0A645EF68_9ZZZZ